MSLPNPLNSYIDHTLLRPNSTQNQFETLLDEIIEYGFASICIAPYMAVPALEALNSTGHPDIKVGTVVGFPHGNLPLALKVAEADYFMERGIDEIDFVLNYGELKNRQTQAVLQELGTMGDICQRRGVISKCIVETCFLDREEKEMIFGYIRDFAPGIDFIKTSTGYGSKGASWSDVILWNKLRGDADRPLIKAAGGIKTYDDVVMFVKAGANRIGTSSGVSIMKEEETVEGWTNGNQTFTEGEKKA